MGEVFLETPKVNAVPYRLFITKGKPYILASIVFADDKQFYLVYSKKVSGVIKELVLTSPFIDRTKKKYVVFRCGSRGRKVKAVGFLVTAKSTYELDLLTEEVRYLISAVIDVPVKVRKVKTEEELPKVEKTLSEEEANIFRLAPLDVPSELEQVLEETEEVIIEETKQENSEH